MNKKEQEEYLISEYKKNKNEYINYRMVLIWDEKLERFYSVMTENDWIQKLIRHFEYYTSENL